MATQQATRKQVVATVKSIAEEKKGGKATYNLQVVRDGMQYPDYITAWPSKEGELERPKVQVGQRYTFTVGAKPKGEGKKGEYWDYLGAESAGEAPSVPAQPSTTPPAADGRDKTTEAPSVLPALQPQDATRLSIERQKAVAEARAGADFLMAQWFADTRVDGATGGTREPQPLPTFLEIFAPKYEELVARLATRFYQSIHGRTE